MFPTQCNEPLRPTAGDPGARRRRATGVALLVLALPAVYFLSLAPRTGRLQWHDYYVVLMEMVDGDHLRSDVLGWLTIKSNEHAVAVPALVYAANAALFHGDNRTLAALAVLCQFAVALSVFAFLGEGARRSASRGAASAAVIGGLAFTPVGAHQFVLGFSGVMWIVADLLAVSAILSLCRAARRPRQTQAMAIAIAAAVAGAFTFSTALAVWPALLLGVALLPRLRRYGPAVVAAALVTGLAAVALYHRPTHHPSLVVARPGALLEFVASFLGWIFTSNRTLAAGLGACGLLACLATWWLTLRSEDAESKARLAPWLLLQVYGGANAAMAAVARSGFGRGAAEQHRYGLLAGLFWLGVFGAAAQLLAAVPERRRRVPASVLLACIAGAAVTATWVQGAGAARRLLADAAWHPFAEIAVRYELADDSAFRRFQNVDARTWLDGPGRAVLPFLRRNAQVPFDRDPRPRFGDVLADDMIAGESVPHPGGMVTRATPLDARILTVEGRIDTGGRAADRVVAVAVDGTVLGELAVVPAASLTVAPARAHAVLVAGYAAPRTPGEPLHLAVRLRGERLFHVIGKPWTRTAHGEASPL
ncbi:MAG: hypothetical protein ACOY3Y_18940 [Acidobacteriota bacterium]